MPDAEFGRGGLLADSLLRYVRALLAQVTKSALCNRYHPIGKRLCRRLLISRDRARSAPLYLTQETLAHVPGAQRTGVAAVAGAPRNEGLIS